MRTTAKASEGVVVEARSGSKGWRTLPLGALGMWRGGGTPSKKNPAFWTGGSIPWVSPKDMKFQVIRDAIDHITAEAVRESATQKIPSGSVLIVTRSGILDHSLPVGVLAVDAAINQDIKAVTPNELVDGVYLAWAIRACAQTVLQECTKDGTTVASVEMSSLLAFKVAVAPRSEQTAILAERRARWEADQIAAFRAKGKVPRDDTWKAKYDPPVAPNTTDLPELPEGWVWASVDQLISALTSGSRDWSRYYGKGTGTFIMAQNIRPGRLDMEFRQPVDPPRDSPDCRRSQVEPGDLLLTIVGANTGDLCMVSEPLPEHYVCQSVAVIRPVIPASSRWMLTWFLSTTAGRKDFEILMYGAARPHLSFKDLLRCTVALPPLAECGRIADRIDVDQSDLDHVATSARRSERKSAALRSAILQAAFQPPQAITGASHGNR